MAKDKDKISLKQAHEEHAKHRMSLIAALEKGQGDWEKLREELGVQNYSGGNICNAAGLKEALAKLNNKAGEVCNATYMLSIADAVANLDEVAFDKFINGSEAESAKILEKCKEGLEPVGDEVEGFVENVIGAFVTDAERDKFIAGLKDDKGQVRVGEMSMYINVKKAVFEGIKSARQGKDAHGKSNENPAIAAKIKYTALLVNKVCDSVCGAEDSTEKTELKGILEDMVDANAVEGLMQGLDSNMDASGNSVNPKNNGRAMMADMFNIAPNIPLGSAQVKFEAWREKMLTNGKTNVSKEALDKLVVTSVNGAPGKFNETLAAAADAQTAMLLEMQPETMQYIDPKNLGPTFQDPAVKVGLDKKKAEVEKSIEDDTQTPGQKADAAQHARNVARAKKKKGRIDENKGLPLRALFKLWGMIRGIVKKLLAPIQGGTFAINWMSACGMPFSTQTTVKDYEIPNGGEQVQKKSKQNENGIDCVVDSGFGPETDEQKQAREQYDALSPQMQKAVGEIARDLNVSRESAIKIAAYSQENNVDPKEAAEKLGIAIPEIEK